MSALTCEQIARAVLGEPSKREGAELLWRCSRREGHSNGDAHPSFKVNPRKDTWGCFVCGVGGTPWQLAAFLARLDPTDKKGVAAWLKEHGLLNGKRPQKADNGRGHCVAEYVYCEVSGNPVARKLRFEPGADGRKKDFVLQRCENGGWVDGLAGMKTPLYRLPEIVASSWVVLTEGEKDADAGAKIGLPTTTSGGVGSFRQDHADVLRSKDVVIIADADDPGREHAQKEAAMLYRKAASVKVCEIPGSKDLAEATGKGTPKNVLLALFEDTPEWEPAKGREILNSVLRFICRFVALTEAQGRVAALWTAHTHAMDAADCTPYLSVNSAEKESGKTRFLEVEQLLVANPWFTGRATAAVLIRKIDAQSPSLLLDESDTAFGGEKEYAETLRGILNTGYKRGGTSSCCIGQGGNISYKDFSTFSPKAIAGIGKLPDTVAGRSIPIRLKREPRSRVERLRKRDAEAETAPIRARLAAWCKVNLESLRDARPTIPEALSDRQADCCEPLLAIADQAGGEWPQAARCALLELCAESEAEDQSAGVRLLTDIRGIFDERQTDRVGSIELAEALAAIETSPWAEWSHGRPITAPKLARLLGRFGIRPGTIRTEGKTLKGYYRGDFEDSFARYIPLTNRHNVTTRINITETPDCGSVTPGKCDGSENAANANKNGPCDVVTSSDKENGVEASPHGANGHSKYSVVPPPRPVPCATCGQILESALALSKHLHEEHSDRNGVPQ